MKILKYKTKSCRWKFWAYMMDNHPRLFWWCDKYLPIDTLPF